MQSAVALVLALYDVCVKPSQAAINMCGVVRTPYSRCVHDIAEFEKTLAKQREHLEILCEEKFGLLGSEKEEIMQKFDEVVSKYTSQHACFEFLSRPAIKQLATFCCDIGVPPDAGITRKFAFLTCSQTQKDDYTRTSK